MAKEKITCENSSGSRLRENVSKVFDCFLIVNRPAGCESDPSLDYKYPPDFDDEEILQQSLLFCFPFDSEPTTLALFNARADHFTFILTDIEGKHRFGFCKLANGGTKCYCILSFVPWFEIFYKVLNYTHELSSQGDEETMETMLTELNQQNVPEHSQLIQISATLAFHTPESSALPSIPENRNLSEYFTSASPGFMMDIFSSLMLERRVVFTSSRLSVLTSCIHSAEALLRPLHWQHIYIPVLPPHLVDYCLAPMPYLMGVHSSLMPKVRDMIELDEEIVVADIDEGEIESAHSDMGKLPNDKMSFLKSLLRKSDVGVGTNLSMAFLRTQARLIGGYRNGLKYKAGKPIMFDEDAFVDCHKSTAAKEFARELVQLQTFKQFVDGRLLLLNAGIGFKDDFETEVNMLDDSRDNDRDIYKEWLSAAKKGGNKFILQVQRKAKDMKVVHQSVKNYVKQQQGKQQQSLQRKKSLNEAASRIRPSRPISRPISVSQESPKEMRPRRAARPTTRPPPPPLMLDPPKPQLRKKRAIRLAQRSTRRYTALDLDADVSPADDDTEGPLKSPNDRERTMSNATYAGVDVDLLSDLELVMDEKITNLQLSPSDDADQQPDLLCDVKDSPSEPTAAAPISASLERKCSSELRRHGHVTSRPHVIRTSAEQSYSSDELPTPEKLLDATSVQLIDLSATCLTTQSDSATAPSAADDLIGLDLHPASLEEPSDSSKNLVFWDSLDVRTEDLAEAPTATDNDSVFVATTTVSSTTEAAGIPESTNSPFVAGNPPKDNASNRLSRKLSPEKLNPFKVSSSPMPSNHGNFALSNRTTLNNTSFSRTTGTTKCQFKPNSDKPLFRTMSGQPIGRTVASSNSEGWKNSKSGAVGNGDHIRGGSLRHNALVRQDSELFSDLLNSWKSKEGM